MAGRRRSPEIIAGRVQGDGSILNGDGFTVTRVAAGQYSLAFASGFRLQSITATAIGATGGYIATTNSQTERTVAVWMMTTAAAGADMGFCFTAVGVQQ